MNTFFFPDVSGLREPALVMLAVIALLGLAFVLVVLPGRHKEESRPEEARRGKPNEFR